MYFDVNRLSGLLLIFFVHGLVYAGLLLKRGIQTGMVSDRWLSFFLLLCVLYICPYMLGFAGWYDGFACINCRNFLFYMPLQHTLLMGPVVYFYLQSLLNPFYRFRRKDLWHFLPGVLYVCWCLIVAVTDRLILKRYFLMDGETDPDFQDWYIILGLLSFLCYLLLSIRYYRNYRRFIVQELSFADTVQFRWIGHFLAACFIYFLSSLLINILLMVFSEIKYSQTWWYYMLFCMVFYYIAISGYSHSIERRKNFELDFLRFRMPGLLDAPEAVTEDISHEELPAAMAQSGSDSRANPGRGSGAPGEGTEAPEYVHWKKRILDLVEGEELFRDPELTLTDLAKKLGTNGSVLSRIINGGFHMNFNDFINYHRVQEVKKQLQNPDNASLTIMSLAYDAGFNSKATFNRAFKKHTGENPSRYQIR